MRPEKRKNKKRKNPAAAFGPAFAPRDVQKVADMAADLLVINELKGCSLNEKVVVSALIPLVIKIIRTAPKSEVEQAVAKLWPPPELGDADKN